MTMLDEVTRTVQNVKAGIEKGYYPPKEGLTLAVYIGIKHDGTWMCSFHYAFKEVELNTEYETIPYSTMSKDFESYTYRWKQ